jgi:hypothetical protein
MRRFVLLRRSCLTELWDGPISYTSTGSLVSNAWYLKTATATIFLTSTELQNPSYVLSYMCSWTGSGWSRVVGRYRVSRGRGHNVLRERKGLGRVAWGFWIPAFSTCEQARFCGSQVVCSRPPTLGVSVARMAVSGRALIPHLSSSLLVNTRRSSARGWRP